MGSTRFFNCLEHEVPCQHIRHRMRATSKSQEEQLSLVVKQYTPVTPASQDPAITIIAAPANGFPKELYEPLWDDLYQSSRTKGVQIRSIWIADVANQGASGLKNRSKLGNDCSWLDHARDLLLMINHFRNKMMRPLFGLGHSMGGTAIVQLALIHPRLLSGLMLIDPILKPRPYADGSDFRTAYLTTFKRDTWTSQSEAEAYFRRSPLHNSWDQRVFSRFLEHALHQSPGPKLDDKAKYGRPVELVTSKHQEASMVARPAYPPNINQPLHEFRPTRITHPDLYGDAASVYQPQFPFYFPDSSILFPQLESLQPNVLFVRPGSSVVTKPFDQGQVLAAMGRGRGGSGGVEHGNVRDEVLPESDHFVPFTKPMVLARSLAGWLEIQVSEYKTEQAEWERWRNLPEQEQQTVDERWKFWMVYQYGQPKHVRDGQKSKM